jgi:HD-like signal output (HDOD) protein
LAEDLRQAEHSRYLIYRSVIARVLNDQEHLPSLPAITMKVRQAISDNNTTTEKLGQLIGGDPALSALLMKAVSSPLYRTQEVPNTLSGVISIMGFSAVNNIVMAHSVNSLFVFQKPALKALYNLTRQRQVIKGSMSVFLAQKLKYRPADEVLMVSLLSEVGTLALLSAFKDRAEVPDTETYFRLCRDYSKSLGVILLNKWGVDVKLVEAVKHCGQWDVSSEGPMSLLDIINLGLYHTVRATSPKAKLPALKELAAYAKLQPPNNFVTSNELLMLVKDNQAEIKAIISSLQ